MVGGEQDWRKTHRSQRSRLEYIIDNDIQEYGDKTIVVGDKLEVQDELHLEGEDPERFRMLLKVMYTGKWDANQKDAIKLVTLAEKYQAYLVSQECSHWLETHGVNVESAIDIYQEAKEYQLPIAEWIWNYILENGMGICQSPTFVKLTKESLLRLAKDDNLRIDDETVIVDAVKRWGTKQREINPSAKMHEIVADVVPELRLYTIISSDAAAILLDHKQATQLQLCKNPDVMNELLANERDALFCVRPRKSFAPA